MVHLFLGLLRYHCIFSFFFPFFAAFLIFSSTFCTPLNDEFYVLFAKPLVDPFFFSQIFSF